MSRFDKHYLTFYGSALVVEMLCGFLSFIDSPAYAYHQRDQMWQIKSVIWMLVCVTLGFAFKEFFDNILDSIVMGAGAGAIFITLCLTKHYNVENTFSISLSNGDGVFFNLADIFIFTSIVWAGVRSLMYLGREEKSERPDTQEEDCGDLRQLQD